MHNREDDGSAMEIQAEVCTTIAATIVPGHRVASGLANDPRFPGGTLALQAPHFAAQGIDLAAFHPGTLNLAIAPYRYRIGQPKCTLRGVRWSSVSPPEDFSFFDCQLIANDRTVTGLVYYPHPETKPEHFQASDILEILAPQLVGIGYGDRLMIAIDPAQMQFFR